MPKILSENKRKRKSVELYSNNSIIKINNNKKTRKFNDLNTKLKL